MSVSSRQFTLSTVYSSVHVAAQVRHDTRFRTVALLGPFGHESQDSSFSMLATPKA